MANINSFESEIDNEDTEETIVSYLNKVKKEDIALISSMSKILNKVIEQNKILKNFSRKVKEQSSMIFSTRIPAKISLYDYLYRIKNYSEIANSTLILGMIYIDRICKNANLLLTMNNVHRVLFGSIVCAAKYNEDIIFNNKYYSLIGGVSLKELNNIEHFFIELIDFNFYVDKKKFSQYEKNINAMSK